MKKTIFIILILFLSNLIADEIEIRAKSFFADEKRKITEFKDDVVIKRGKDFINAKHLVVNFNQKNEPIIYEASGGVDFELTLQENRRYKGRANIVRYDVLEFSYTLSGDVFVQEIDGDRSMKGEKVLINLKTNQAQVLGTDNKPVIFKFSVKEKK